MLLFNCLFYLLMSSLLHCRTTTGLNSHVINTVAIATKLWLPSGSHCCCMMWTRQKYNRIILLYVIDMPQTSYMNVASVIKIGSSTFAQHMYLPRPCPPSSPHTSPAAALRGNHALPERSHLSRGSWTTSCGLMLPYILRHLDVTVARFSPTQRLWSLCSDDARWRHHHRIMCFTHMFCESGAIFIGFVRTCMTVYCPTACSCQVRYIKTIMKDFWLTADWCLDLDHERTCRLWVCSLAYCTLRTCSDVCMCVSDAMTFCAD